MKKIASILVLVFAFTLTTQGQKKRKDKRPNFSVEQRTELAVKKMTLDLDLYSKITDANSLYSRIYLFWIPKSLINRGAPKIKSLLLLNHKTSIIFFSDFSVLPSQPNKV